MVDKCCVEFINGQNMVDKTKEAYQLLIMFI